MAKTGKQVQGDVRELLIGSALYSMVSGEVYRDGMRPRDSRKEDIVVVFTSGNTAQVQSGVVTVKIYVPDVDPYQNGVLTEDGARLEEIEVAAQAFVEQMNIPNYLFRLAQTIHTSYDEEVNQHFVVVRLRFRYGEN